MAVEASWLARPRQIQQLLADLAGRGLVTSEACWLLQSSWNTRLNMIDQHRSRLADHQTRMILASSFAHFQSDVDIVVCGRCSPLVAAALTSHRTIPTDVVLCIESFFGLGWESPACEVALIPIWVHYPRLVILAGLLVLVGDTLGNICTDRRYLWVLMPFQFDRHLLTSASHNKLPWIAWWERICIYSSKSFYRSLLLIVVVLLEGTPV